MTKRTPRQLIELYWEEVWNRGNVELIREICSDPMIRHHPGRQEILDHDQQVARLYRLIDELKPHFTHEVLVADDHAASSVWNMTSETGKFPRISSIETFRIREGRLWQTWNATNAFELWG